MPYNSNEEKNLKEVKLQKMKTEIEQQKQAMKEKLSQSVDQFFEQYKELMDNNAMSIDEIERIWGEGIDRSSEIYNETIKGLTDIKSDKEVKKTLPMLWEKLKALG
ncbi:MAG: hypothetical protein LBI03_06235 [Clostridiales bacterium]|jgi:soluble cytochrome b562|nr:hypothetical protein [Clostridiales bacterium]